MNAKPSVLIFSTVWPEPQSSAAGVRQMQWIRFFLTRGYSVTLASPSKLRQPGEWGYCEFPSGVQLESVPMNQSEWEGKSMKAWLAQVNPTIVMFDRFLLEEQFGHWIYECCPQARVWIETQDLHFVRRLREASAQSGHSWNLETPLEAWFDHAESDSVLRELASIQRVDHTFVVSSFEERLLIQTFEISPGKVSWVPMVADAVLAGTASDPQAKIARLPFERRNGFCFVGNFRHQPNLTGLRWFRGEVWPRIRIRFPQARVQIFGAYPSEEVMSWNKPQDGFEVKGQVDDVAQVFQSARVNIAPLLFGAGVKGKVLEAMAQGIPTVGTELAFEGILSASEAHAQGYPGLAAQTAQLFAEACIALHEDPTLWSRMQRWGLELTESQSLASIEAKMEKILKRNDAQSPLSRILRHETLNYRKYFAKWIEAKQSSAAIVRTGSVEQPLTPAQSPQS